MLMRSLVLGSLLALFLVSPALAQSAKWNVDMGHSEVSFTARHLAFAKVRGEFKTFTANIEADEKTGKLTKLTAEVEAKSVDTGVDKRDADLRSDHFFAVEKYPKLKLDMKSIKWNGNKFTAVVALTIRNTTKDVAFEGELLGVQTVNFGQGPHQRAAYEASATINRKEFGLNFNGLAEGISIVADEVEIELSAEVSLPPKK
jgi:polyisoprenoid-binding protein YceI